VMGGGCRRDEAHMLEVSHSPVLQLSWIPPGARGGSVNSAKRTEFSLAVAVGWSPAPRYIKSESAVCCRQ
ncbi:Hypothetical predicted protein, partial [Marmota monax]